MNMVPNMTDPRYTKLAKLLVNYSTALKKGDRVLLDMIDVPDEFTVELIRAVRAAGATPFVETRHTRVGRELLLGITEAQAADMRDLELFRMKKDAGLHRPPRRGQHERKFRRAQRPDADVFARSSGRCWITASTRRAGACCAGPRPAWPRPPA